MKNLINKKYFKCFLIEIPILAAANLVLYLLEIDFNFISYIEGVLMGLLTMILLEDREN